MSKDLVLGKYIHNNLCEMPGCREMSKITIGIPDASGGLKLNICPECLQTIVNIVPLEMIMNRPDIKEMLQEDEKENTPEFLNPHSEFEKTMMDKLENVGKALEGDEAEYNMLGFNELKSLAVAKGLSFKVGMSKVDLINYLTEQ